MKKFLSNPRYVTFAVFLIFFITTFIYAFSTGITDRTRKSSDPGCTCHTPSPSSSVNVAVTGPDSVTIGTTANYTLTISGGPLAAAGTNIATRLGTLNVVSSSLQKISGELTHVSPISPSGSSVTAQFSYTAPATPGTDTIWANGNSVNLNGLNTGDQWNFAPDKRIIVRSPIGIKNITTSASTFKLSQNYPNPFNPVTNIEFSIPSQEHVKLAVYDMTGKMVAGLINGDMNAGKYKVDFDAASLTSGVYFYKLTAGSFSETRRMTLVK